MSDWETEGRKPWEPEEPPNEEDAMLRNLGWLFNKCRRDGRRWRAETMRMWTAFWEDPETQERLKNGTLTHSQRVLIEDLFSDYDRVLELRAENRVPPRAEGDALAYSIGWAEGRLSISQEHRLRWGGPDWPDG